MGSGSARLGLIALAQQLARARNRAARLARDLDHRRMVWAERHAVLIDAARSATEEALTLERALREGAERLHAEMGDADPVPRAVGIVEMTRLDYDPVAIVRWAVANGRPELLLPNDHAIRARAATLPPHVIWPVRVFRARVAHDLCRALGVGPLEEPEEATDDGRAAGA